MARKNFKETFHSWTSLTTGGVLIANGALAFLYDTVRRLFPKYAVLSPEEALIFFVAFLCVSLGAERFLTFKDIEADIKKSREKLGAMDKRTAHMSTDLDALVSRVRRFNRGEILIGHTEIEAAAHKLIDSSDDSARIKATGQHTATDSLSHKYFEHLAERVAHAKKNKGTMEYHVVVSSGAREPEGEDPRVKLFRDRHIRDRLMIRTVAHPWPFEVLIGGQSMIIALVGGRNESKYEAAVRITDPAFTEKAAEWFHDVVWSGAEAQTGERES